MIIEKITSENPSNHWRFLNVKDRITMDMGCSFWDSTWNEGWLSSSEWFVFNEAKKVIGFDAAQHDIDKYHQLYGRDSRYEMYQLHVSNSEQLLDSIKKYKPEVIKCDIEGAEIHFQELSKEDMESVVEVAIEYHNGPTKEMCEKMLPEWGFEIVALYQLGGESTDRVGVYHAIKK